jgi:hypothetical protein
VNVLFGIIVSVIFVSIYATRLHWSIIPIYIGGASLIAYVTNLLSKRIKVIQKNIVKESEVKINVKNVLIPPHLKQLFKDTFGEKNLEITKEEIDKFLEENS